MSTRQKSSWNVGSLLGAMGGISVSHMLAQKNSIDGLTQSFCTLVGAIIGHFIWMSFTRDEVKPDDKNENMPPPDIPAQ